MRLPPLILGLLLLPYNAGAGAWEQQNTMEKKSVAVNNFSSQRIRGTRTVCTVKHKLRTAMQSNDVKQISSSRLGTIQFFTRRNHQEQSDQICQAGGNFVLFKNKLIVGQNGAKERFKLKSTHLPRYSPSKYASRPHRRNCQTSSRNNE